MGSNKIPFTERDKRNPLGEGSSEKHYGLAGGSVVSTPAQTSRGKARFVNCWGGRECLWELEGRGLSNEKLNLPAARSCTKKN